MLAASNNCNKAFSCCSKKKHEHWCSVETAWVQEMSNSNGYKNVLFWVFGNSSFIFVQKEGFSKFHTSLDFTGLHKNPAITVFNYIY